MHFQFNPNRNLPNLRKVFCFCVLFTAIQSTQIVFAQIPRNLEVTANVNGQDIAPTFEINLKLNRPLSSDEGTLAIVIDDIDLTSLSLMEPTELNYIPKTFPLKVGENKLSVYLVSSEGTWNLMKTFLFRVAEAKPQVTDKPKADQSHKKTEFEFSPNVSLNFKSESNVGFFPESAKPERLSFVDTAGQGVFKVSVKKNGWSIGSQFDFAGSSLKREALRFGELGQKASNIDLSSYQLNVEKGKFKVQLGHVSFGDQRHLINSFSSRGLKVIVPIGKQNEVSFSLLNGSSIVGFDNFLGIARADHNVFGVTFAREFFKENPGRLRVEVTGMRGSLLPLHSFNERAIVDAERSFGGTIRLQAKDKSERLRFEGGFTRSRFTNPSDPFLEQEFSVTAIRPITRNARFIETSFEFLKDKKVLGERQMTLTGTFRHEEIQPLFRSVAVSSQADRRQFQYEVTGSLGDVNFTFGNLRERDNLRNISSILKTLGRQRNANISFSPGTLFNPQKPIKHLPRIGYTYNEVHQFGEFLPQRGDFRELSQVPDQKSFSHTLSAEFPISDQFSFSYRYNRAFQDNRQSGRELADFLSQVHSANFSINAIKNVTLGFDLSKEQQKNFEDLSVNNQFRLGSNISWQNALFKNSTLSANLSGSISGDRANTNDSRDGQFDIQWAYRFEFGKEEFKKMRGQFFVRYANRYGERFDRIFGFNNFNKNQGFNLGINFNFF